MELSNIRRSASRVFLCQKIQPGLTFLPFLYQTRTLRNYHLDLTQFTNSDREQPDQHNDEKPGVHGLRHVATRHLTDGSHSRGGDRDDSNSASHDIRSQQPFKAARYTAGPISDSANYYRDTGPQQLASGFVDERPPHVEEDFVPFAGVPQLPDLIDPSKSTLTVNEKEALDRLMSLLPVEKVIDEPAPRIVRRRKPVVKSDLDNILDEAIKGMAAAAGKSTPDSVTFKGTQHTTVKLGQQSRKTRKGQVAKQTASPRLTDERKKEMDRVESLLHKAKTDAEVWEIVQKDIFGPVAALNLDQPEESAEDRARTGKDPKMAILGPNFPLLLTRAANILRREFPTSAFLLAVIPELHKAGPTTFALGASTELYNIVLRQLSEQHTDVFAVGALLNEMEREVIEPDYRTMGVLLGLLGEAKKARQGVYGGVARLFWVTDMVKAATKEIGAVVAKLRTTVTVPTFKKVRSVASS